MAHTFKYPTIADPVVTLSFSRAWYEGDERYIRRNQEVRDTYGGSIQALDRGQGIQIQPFTVRVPRYSGPGLGHETDWADVVTFISNIVRFAIYPFWWTDEDSKSRLVRIENQDTSPTNVFVNMIDYQFQLRIIQEI